MANQFEGIWTALVTPFNSKGEVDYSSFEKLVDFQIESGVAGLVPCGTTGESPTLSTDEKKRLIEICIEKTRDKDCGVIAGTGSNHTQSSIEFSRWASDAGADGVLLVCPYYNKPSQEGLFQHFTAIADAITCDAVLYNVPGRTVTGLTADTIARLAAHPRISAIKDATADMAFCSQTQDRLRNEGQSLQILSGDDLTFLPLLSIGAVGTISVASNLIPSQMTEMALMAKRGEFKKARTIHEKYFPLFRDLFVDSNPVPVKHALSLLGFGTDQVRAPLAQLQESHSQILKSTLKSCGVLK